MWIDKLKSAPKYDPKSIRKEDIPTSIGLYAWFSRNNRKIAYIGIAVNKKGGLRRRVWRQHLNPKYLEKREERFRTKDSFQLTHPVLVNGKVVICKSAFRRNVARLHHLRAGAECVEYIKKNFILTFIPFPKVKKDLVKKIEKELISAIKPKYNISHKR